MNIGELYRFYFADLEKAREHLRTWSGRANIYIADTLKAGFIDLWSYDPDKTAEKFGGARYERKKQ